jgi:hypothetical protein
MGTRSSSIPAAVPGRPEGRQAREAERYEQEHAKAHPLMPVGKKDCCADHGEQEQNVEACNGPEPPGPQLLQRDAPSVAGVSSRRGLSLRPATPDGAAASPGGLPRSPSVTPASLLGDHADANGAFRGQERQKPDVRLIQVYDGPDEQQLVVDARVIACDAGD